jgi:hypothetical protein
MRRYYFLKPHPFRRGIDIGVRESAWSSMCLYSISLYPEAQRASNKCIIPRHVLQRQVKATHAVAFPFIPKPAVQKRGLGRRVSTSSLSPPFVHVRTRVRCRTRSSSQFPCSIYTRKRWRLRVRTIIGALTKRTKLATIISLAVISCRGIQF